MNNPRFELRHYAELDSTNEEAKRLLAAGEILRPTLIRADGQTAGKGTQGRQWFSPPGAGLYFSIVHPFDSPEKGHADLETDSLEQAALAYGVKDGFGPALLNEWESASGRMDHVPLTPLFTLAAGVACAETLVTLTGLTIQLKPVNDLYVEGRKLGGILTESLISENRCKAMITGIGINVREHEAIQSGCVQENRGHQPISLQACIAPQLFEQWHPDALLHELSQAIAMAVDGQYQQLSQGQAPALLANYLRYKLPHVDLPDGIERLVSLI